MAVTIKAVCCWERSGSESHQAQIRSNQRCNCHCHYSPGGLAEQFTRSGQMARQLTEQFRHLQDMVISGNTHFRLHTNDPYEIPFDQITSPVVTARPITMQNGDTFTLHWNWTL